MITADKKLANKKGVRFKIAGIKTVPALVYSDTTKLLMDRFIDCIVEGDLTYLIKSGKPTEQQLEIAWATILSDYAMKIGDDRYLRLIQVVKDYEQNRDNFIRAESIIKVLEICRSTVLIEELNYMGIDGEFIYDDANPDAYYKSLQIAYSQAKTFLVYASQAENELKTLREGFSKEAPTRDSFDQNFNSLSQYMRYNIDPGSITVSRYCQLINRLKNYIQVLQKPTYK